MLRKQSRAEFERLMLPHLDAAHNLARWLLRHSQDAEDAVQDAYLRAFKAFDGYAGGDAKAWLMTIVRNACLTRLKRRSSGTVILFDDRQERPEVAQDVNVYGQGAPLLADVQLIAQHERGRVTRALMALPEPFREAVVLREFEELSYAQIAEITGVPTGTVMSRLARARQRLKSLLVEDGTEDAPDAIKERGEPANRGRKHEV